MNIIQRLARLLVHSLPIPIPSRSCAGSSYKPNLARVASVGLACISLVGCSRYQMTVNETVVYSPPALLTDFQVADRELRNCLDQTIKDNHHTAINQLTRLSCSHAGISNLAGLETFQQLTELNLSNNQLTSIQPLQFLPKLTILLLDQNRLTNVAELLLLPNLQQINLNQNPQLGCGDLRQLQQTFTGKLLLPEQCRQG